VQTARDVRGQSAHPENDLLEPSAREAEVLLLADASIPVN